ncbi:DMT family transporter [Aestuariivirga litoralis]|uniref:DMT family transporter n=1 Tax=Aestuariivirga litoralis TaxID=2650924 RepID=UPI0018C69427|nr:DMT family transporter [Aestuariivirga litoralis]MBG1231875.1 DMT family transporter [Aestuariivirga litoralis]
MSGNSSVIPAGALPNRRAGAILAVSAACCLTTLQDVGIKWISGAYPFHEMQTIRCAIGLCMILLVVVSRRGLRSLTVPDLPLALLRGGLLAMASVLFYLALSGMNYPEAVAMYFTMPLWVVPLAALFFHERVPAFRWLAVAVGFIGVLFILKPGTALFAAIAILALLAAFFYALGNVLTRPLSRTTDAVSVAFWQNVMYLAAAVILAAIFGSGKLHMTGHVSLDYLTRGWLWPSARDFVIMALIGCCTGVLMVLMTYAYQLADSSFVAPFEFSQMVWAIALSFLIWRQLPDVYAFIGIALILGSGILVALWERRKGRLS